MQLSGKHRVTLEAVFADPVRSGVAWREIEALFEAWRVAAKSVKAKARACALP
jgi:hypothetical protein